MKRNYKFVKYIIHKINNEKAVIQNEVGTIVIENKSIIDFIYNMDTKEKKIVNIKDFQKYFSDRYEEVIEFLVNNNVIFPYEEPHLALNKIYIIGDDDFVNKALYDVYIEEMSYVKVIRLKDLSKLEHLENSLIISFLSEYEESKVQNLYNLLKKCKDSYIYISYAYNHSIYFNCIYGGDLSTPCHFCTKGVVDGQIYGKDENLTYQNILEMIYTDTDDFKISYPLTTRQKSIVITTIIKQVDGILPNNNYYYTYKHPQDFTNVYKLDLYSLQVKRDNAIFWELCDCYEDVLL